jgi:serine/threonine-protein kinase
MELLEGETLEAYLARVKGSDPREALAIGEKVLAALEVAHGAALVHRDIKPANIFLPRGGGVKLLDFGLARGLDETQPEAAARGFTLYGTPEYMAPEQAASGQIDARADLYALGCVLYEMLTGRIPFVGPSSVAILDAKIKGSPDRLRDRAPAREIPGNIDDLVMKALARHPSERFQTATEMRQAIAKVLHRPARRSGGRVAVAALLACSLLAAGAFTPRGKSIRAAIAQLPWLRARTVAVAEVTPKPAPEAAPVPATTAEPAAGEDGLEDGDTVDDTPDEAKPAASADPSAAAPAPAPVVTPAATAEPIAAAPEKPHHKKRAKQKTAKNDDTKSDAPKPDKPARRKHKAKVAHVE